MAGINYKWLLLVITWGQPSTDVAHLFVHSLLGRLTTVAGNEAEAV